MVEGQWQGMHAKPVFGEHFEQEEQTVAANPEGERSAGRSRERLASVRAERDQFAE